jgi:RHS repeat-associated protein
VKTVRHYTNETDNPSWVTGTGTAAAQTDIFTTALASSLNATRKVNGTTTTTYLNIGNLHGDTITSLQLPSAGYVAGPNELNVFDEYGVQQALNPEDRPDGVSTQPNPSSLFILNYGSLGQPQRETTDTGIQFMGARGYNPITGQFLTPDPITGGNETPYNYPNDPINMADISGTLGILSSMTIAAIAFWSVSTFFAGACIGSVICAVVVAVGVGIVSSRLAAHAEAGLDRLKNRDSTQANFSKADRDAVSGYFAGETGKSKTKLSKKYSLAVSAEERKRLLSKGAGRFGLGVDLGQRATDLYVKASKPGSKIDWYSELIY